MKKDIRAYTYEQLAAEMEQIGEKKFRAKQIYEWLHVKLADSFEEMTNLSKALREKLEAEYEILPVKMLERQISKIDATNKFLFQLSDGNVVESVLMRYKHGNSVCISSQVGCRMGCRFCASTIGGLERNLSPSEMLGQIYQIQKITGERVSNVVVMGTGCLQMNTDCISAREISRFPPVGSCRRSASLPWSICRSHWHFLCTALLRKRESSSCRWQINMTCRKCSKHVIFIFRRQEEG